MYFHTFTRRSLTALNCPISTECSWNSPWSPLTQIKASFQIQGWKSFKSQGNGNSRCKIDQDRLWNSFFLPWRTRIRRIPMPNSMATASAMSNSEITQMFNFIADPNDPKSQWSDESLTNSNDSFASIIVHMHLSWSALFGFHRTPFHV